MTSWRAGLADSSSDDDAPVRRASSKVEVCGPTSPGPTGLRVLKVLCLWNAFRQVESRKNEVRMSRDGVISTTRLVGRPSRPSRQIQIFKVKDGLGLQTRASTDEGRGCSMIDQENARHETSENACRTWCAIGTFVKRDPMRRDGRSGAGPEAEQQRKLETKKRQENLEARGSGASRAPWTTGMKRGRASRWLI